MITARTDKNALWYSGTKLTTTHAVFTRHGGYGEGAFRGLNLSFSVGDKRENVLKNRKKIKKILNIEFLVSSRQVHSDKIARIAGIRSDRELSGYDALITSQPGVGLLIQQADCQAILLHDPRQKVIAAIHNGWRGSVANIIGLTVQAMEDDYGVRPENIQALISPGLGPCCAEFTNYKMELHPSFLPFQIETNHFDFPAISRDQLIRAGIAKKMIEDCTLCTACERDFFSYRRTRKSGLQTTGRNGSVIALAQGQNHRSAGRDPNSRPPEPENPEQQARGCVR